MGSIFDPAPESGVGEHVGRIDRRRGRGGLRRGAGAEPLCAGRGRAGARGGRGRGHLQGQQRHHPRGLRRGAGHAEGALQRGGLRADGAACAGAGHSLPPQRFAGGGADGGGSAKACGAEGAGREERRAESAHPQRRGGAQAGACAVGNHRRSAVRTHGGRRLSL